jgi:phosphatidylglycerophosphate synthase
MKKKLVKKNDDAFPRKTPIEGDNIFDVFLYYIADCLSPFFKKLNFTPNMFTTLSFITGLLSCYYYYKKKYTLAPIFYIISYWFDTIDGHYARKYNMQTKFGDYYDHITDGIVSIILIILAFFNTDMPTYIKKYVAISLFITLQWTAYHFNCVEKRNKNDKRYIKSETINFITPTKCNDKLTITSIFNTGTVTVILSLYLYSHHYYKLKY